MIKGTLYLVPTPVGNLGDMTYRGVEVLNTVDLVAAEDTRNSTKLLNHYGIKNKLVSYHKFNERKQTKTFLGLLERGNNIAVITDAGTPAISDPASVLVKAAIQQNITVTCLPGATALIPALAASGLDTDSFTFVGFLPVRQKERKNLLTALAELSHTIVLYESTHRLTDTMKELTIYFNSRQAVIAKEISKIHEAYFRGTMTELVESSDLDLRGEFVILIEGKSKADLSDEDLRAIISKEFAISGTATKEIVNKLSIQTKLPKNRIYKFALEHKKKN